MRLLLAIVSSVLTLVIAPFFLQIGLTTLAAFVRRLFLDRGGPSRPKSEPRFLFVIPAHDEQGIIGSTVASCLAVDYDPGRYQIFVIADNCTDGTADEAQKAGARVVERQDPDHRTKGHALEYFFNQLPDAYPDEFAAFDAAVLIDADTVVDPKILRRFATELEQGKDWLQCYYSVSNPDASWRTRLMTIAFGMFNGVALLGQDTLGMSVGLRGNGMGFSKQGLSRVPWKAYGLAEDLEFAWKLRVAGERVRFVRETHVLGEMVSRSGVSAAHQRRRWEMGRKAVAQGFVRPLLASPKLGVFKKLVYLIDLVFPPLSTLLLLWFTATVLNAIALAVESATTLSIGLALVQSAMLGVLLLYVVSPFLIMKIPPRYLASLAILPYYIAWKVVIMMGRRPMGWVRTAREAPAQQAGNRGDTNASGVTRRVPSQSA